MQSNTDSSDKNVAGPVGPAAILLLELVSKFWRVRILNDSVPLTFQDATNPTRMVQIPTPALLLAHTFPG